MFNYKQIKALFLSISLLHLPIGGAVYSEEKTLPMVFRIDDSFLSGLDLPKREVKAHPGKEFYQRKIFKGSTLSVFALGSETVTNEINDFPIDEFVYYLNGRADIEVKENVLTFWSGDYLVVPKGFSGKWTNNGGPNHHLELSVISNERAKGRSEEKIPRKLDRAMLSGILPTPNGNKPFQSILYQGPELIISAEIEPVSETQIELNPKETFIHVLNGAVRIVPSQGEAQQFFAGDFFIITKGFSGKWIVTGSNGLRTLKVKVQSEIK